MNREKLSRQSERGQSMVELALTITLLMVLLGRDNRSWTSLLHLAGAA